MHVNSEKISETPKKGLDLRTLEKGAINYGELTKQRARIWGSQR